MTLPGKGDIHKKGQRSSVTIPIHQSTGGIPHNLILSGRPRISVTVSNSPMLPTPTRVIVKALLKTLLQILLKLWRWASSFLVLICLAAWFYGGFLPYFLCVMAFLSKFHGNWWGFFGEFWKVGWVFDSFLRLLLDFGNFKQVWAWRAIITIITSPVVAQLERVQPLQGMNFRSQESVRQQLVIMRNHLRQLAALFFQPLPYFYGICCCHKISGNISQKEN